MNNVVWEPIDDFWEHKSEIAGVQRSTQYNGRNNGIGIHMTHLQGVCCVIAAEVLPPNVRLCRAASLPQPDWANAPEWAQWGAIEPDGNVSWHETEPQVVLFYWFGDGRNERAIGVFIDIPLGVDWRLLKFQRPQEEPA